MQDEEITPTPEYIKAFNNGYVLKKFAPKILAAILNPTAKDEFQQKEALILGARLAAAEKLKEEREQREQRQHTQGRKRGL